MHLVHPCEILLLSERRILDNAIPDRAGKNAREQYLCAQIYEATLDQHGRSQENKRETSLAVQVEQTPGKSSRMPVREQMQKLDEKRKRNDS